MPTHVIPREDELVERGPAQPRVLTFWWPGRLADDEVPRDSMGRMLVLTKKQLRRRTLRRIGPDGRVMADKRRKKKGQPWNGARTMGDAEARKLIATAYKPLDEWDDEELARGRPRDRFGGFRGSTPQWLPREVHEEAINRFKEILRGKMRKNANEAIALIERLITDERVDDRGKPLTPPSVKLDAAKFLIEHVVGKPKQEITADLSVKLQAVLAAATTSGPVELPGTLDSAMADASQEMGVIDAESWEDEGEDDDDE